MAEKRRVLIYSPIFYPDINGVCVVNALLAEELTKRGYDVVVMTPIADEKMIYSFNYKVVRSKSNSELWRWYIWCEIFIHSGLTLSKIWPIFVARRKFVIIHHACSYNWNGTINFKSKIKRFLTHFGKNVTVSEIVGKKLDIPSSFKVIHNAYNSSLYRLKNFNDRSDFIYVGRLSEEKGVDLLLKSFIEYSKRCTNNFKLTIVGNNDNIERYLEIINGSGYEDRVEFKGSLFGEDLVNELNNHHCIVVPSTCFEAFGLVALEGLACGCCVLGSDSDGIYEAAEKFGEYFKKGDINDLADKMLKMERYKIPDFEKHNIEISAYLDNFTPDKMAENYIRFINNI